MAITIRDVARVAGVPVASLSRAVNSHPNATAPTCARLARLDDLPVSRCVRPPTTTMRACITELGGLALHCLASEIEMAVRNLPQHQALGADLVVRRSTGADTS